MAMNVNLNANSPAERIVMVVCLIGILIDLADITWVRPVEAPIMTHEQALQVCGGETWIKRLAAYEVECFASKSDQVGAPAHLDLSMPWHFFEHPPDGWRCHGDSVGGGEFRCYEEGE